MGKYDFPSYDGIAQQLIDCAKVHMQNGQPDKAPPLLDRAHKILSPEWKRQQAQVDANRLPDQSYLFHDTINAGMGK